MALLITLSAFWRTLSKIFFTAFIPLALSSLNFFIKNVLARVFICSSFFLKKFTAAFLALPRANPIGVYLATFLTPFQTFFPTFLKNFPIFLKNRRFRSSGRLLA